MKTLSSPVTSQAALTAQAWLEVYDIYLRAEITTPWGTISTLRLCTLPGGFAFFAPTLWPEPEGTRGGSSELPVLAVDPGPGAGDTAGCE